MTCLGDALPLKADAGRGVCHDLRVSIDDVCVPGLIQRLEAGYLFFLFHVGL